jgi:hypothetical protein
VILGGTLFDVLEQERGPEACLWIVQRLKREGPHSQLEAAFGARRREVEGIWRDYLRETARPSVE